MIEALAAVCAVLVAFIWGKRKGRAIEKVEGYDSTKARIDSVTRSDDSDVADRLRKHL